MGVIVTRIRREICRTRAIDLAAAEGYTINRDLTFKLAAKANSIVRYLGRGNLETTMSWDDGKSAVTFGNCGALAILCRVIRICLHLN